MMKNISVLQSLIWLARLSLAQAVNGFLFLLNIVSFSLPYTGEIKPYFLLGLIYFWSIYRPTLVPVWAVFAFGLLLDLLSGFPVGVNTIPLLLIRWIVTDQRLFLTGQSYIAIWFFFGASALLFTFIQWTMFALIQEGIPALLPPITAFVLSVCLFPLMSIMLHVVQKLLPLRSHDFTIARKPI